MTMIPSDAKLDRTLSILHNGYTFIERRCRENHTDIFETRILGEKALCLHGREGASIFYDSALFQRKGATPSRIQKTLFGQKGVQTLDREAHRHRKEAFMSLMNSEAVKKLEELTNDQWGLTIRRWEELDEVIVFDETRDMMCKIACAWAGVPLKEAEVEKKAKDLAAMVDAFGGVALRHWQGKQARQRTEKWMMELIEQVRSHELQVPEGTALHLFANHRDLDGKLLPRQVAAVEVINIIRPLVAIAW